MVQYVWEGHPMIAVEAGIKFPLNMRMSSNLYIAIMSVNGMETVLRMLFAHWVGQNVVRYAHRTTAAVT